MITFSNHILNDEQKKCLYLVIIQFSNYILEIQTGSFENKEQINSKLREKALKMKRGKIPILIQNETLVSAKYGENRNKSKRKLSEGFLPMTEW